MYLTFDDGPIPEVTPWVLQQLKAFDAQATFFCVGENVKKNPEIFQEIIQQKHRIGHHTFNHINGWKTKNKNYFHNVEMGNEMVQSNLFRPPYGKLKRAQIQYLKQKYKLIMWDVLTYDFDKKTSPQKCLQNVVHNVQSGSIIVFHDSVKAKENLFYTLPRTLGFLKDKGFSFAALP